MAALNLELVKRERDVEHLTKQLGGYHMLN
jgi:hypothetical protein